MKAKRGWRDGFEVVTPEYEDCARVAREHGVPLREVYAAVRSEPLELYRVESRVLPVPTASGERRELCVPLGLAVNPDDTPCHPSNEIRQQFIDFFVQEARAHVRAVVARSCRTTTRRCCSPTPGMNQFKPSSSAPRSAPYKRAANTQKCIRAGGKHNDLDDVGKDTYHHTFFEMLGNWSFGDYFKKEAIAWAWELLTEVWKLDPTRLHVTVFEGDPANGVPRDDEAAELWKAVGVARVAHPPAATRRTTSGRWATPARAARAPRSTIDRTPDKTGGKLVNAGTAEVIEIWNLVFIQFNRNADQIADAAAGEARRYRHGLRADHDGAPGQGRATTTPTCSRRSSTAIQKVTQARRRTRGKLDDLKDTAYRVIADHIRTLTFALTDGATHRQRRPRLRPAAHPAPGGAVRLAGTSARTSRSCTSWCRRWSSTWAARSRS